MFDVDLTSLLGVTAKSLPLSSTAKMIQFWPSKARVSANFSFTYLLLGMLLKFAPTLQIWIDKRNMANMVNLWRRKVLIMYYMSDCHVHDRCVVLFCVDVIWNFWHQGSIQINIGIMLAWYIKKKKITSSHKEWQSIKVLHTLIIVLVTLVIEL